MSVISVDGRISVDDLLRALGLEKIPEGCELSLDDDVEIAVAADREALYDELTEDDEREIVPLHYLKDAVSALRDGHTKLAMALFESVFPEYLAPEMAVIETTLLQRRAA